MLYSSIGAPLSDVSISLGAEGAIPVEGIHICKFFPQLLTPVLPEYKWDCKSYGDRDNGSRQ